MATEKELIDVIGKLRKTISSMIGHPENPFDEQYLQEMVDLADEHLDTGTTYYAIFDAYDTKDYLIIGLNFTDKEKIRQDLIDNQEDQFDSEEDFELFKAMTLEEMCAHLNYVLEEDTQPHFV